MTIGRKWVNLISKEFFLTSSKNATKWVLFLELLFAYFNLLFSLFQGIEFLSRLDHCRCHAVHAAIVLNHEHVLLKPEQIHAPLCKICFASFLRKYYLNTQPFLTRLGRIQKLIKYLRLSALPKCSMASSHKVFC